jgi:hypothetical protein
MSLCSSQTAGMDASAISAPGGPACMVHTYMYACTEVPWHQPRGTFVLVTMHWAIATATMFAVSAMPDAQGGPVIPMCCNMVGFETLQRSWGTKQVHINVHSQESLTAEIRMRMMHTLPRKHNTLSREELEVFRHNNFLLPTPPKSSHAGHRSRSLTSLPQQISADAHGHSSRWRIDRSASARRSEQ